MLIKRPPDIPSSEITPEPLYRARRQFLGRAGGLALATLGGWSGRLGAAQEPERPGGGKPLSPIQSGAFTTDETRTPYKDVTRYNNFYEFGADKEDPAERAQSLRPAPWSVTLEGALERPGRYALEDLLKPHALEERVYRLRCVEAWSMVIPWVGFPLGDLLRRFQPTANAKYVEFTTLLDPDQMPGQRRPLLEWPYVEGLRMDEAMHPLAILAVGLYGEVLPNQNGAPLRLVVPWKYGFKSIKSIVRIRLLETQPVSSWMRATPEEYGFYAQVPHTGDHPRWSQKTERRLDGSWLPARRETLMFNGYGEQVASLYQGMDLRAHF